MQVRMNDTLMNYQGWTPELFQEKYLEQDGKCSGCKRALAADVKHNQDEEQGPLNPKEILCGTCVEKEVSSGS